MVKEWLNNLSKIYCVICFQCLKEYIEKIHRYIDLLYEIYTYERLNKPLLLVWELDLDLFAQVLVNIADQIFIRKYELSFLLSSITTSKLYTPWPF